MDNTGEKEVSPFKKALIRHRRRGDNPNRIDDLKELVDFGTGQDKRIINLELPQGTKKIPNVYSGPIYGLEGFPGFLYAPQALSESLQFELAYQSVSEYCESPHATNIDKCPPKKSEVLNYDQKMWDLWKEENKLRDARKKQKVDHGAKKKYRTFKKLSWATMGYHYDWTERSYHEGCKSPMPLLVRDLAKIFARTSLLLEATNNPVSFTPSASIVNYYTSKSTMGGHRDDLELAVDKPIVSLSIGLPAIFLLGGKSKESEPVVPILIRKGDVLCMGGESRLNFHAMARLLPNSANHSEVEPTLCPDAVEQLTLDALSIKASGIQIDDRCALEEYLSNHRININVRQVYPDA